jgi:uncharacterized protein YqeY
MTTAGLQARIRSDMKTAIKTGQKPRLAVIRLIMAAIKQREVDERITLDDQQVLIVLDKMLKQRQESVRQYNAAGRNDLVAAEQAEITLIQDYLPAALTADEIATIIAQAFTQSGASSMQDMGKLMALIKPQVQGRANMAEISAQVKQRLANG